MSDKPVVLKAGEPVEILVRRADGTEEPVSVSADWKFTPPVKLEVGDLLVLRPGPTDTADHSARLAWARFHAPEFVRDLDTCANGLEYDRLLSTLDQRYREAHAGPPEGWGHAELVAIVRSLRDRATADITAAPDGECERGWDAAWRAVLEMLSPSDKVRALAEGR